MKKCWMQGLTAVAAASLMVACGGGGDGGESLFPGEGGASSPDDGVSEVSNGVPSQRSMSIAVEKYNLDWSLDGDTTSISVRVTDTAGNPVPDGTLVQFSTEGGQVQKSCALTGVSEGSSTISQCSVTFATQNVRPADALVSIVAWMNGQEAYIDNNGDGRFQTGEPFYDSGRIFRDDDESASYTPNVDELNVGSAVGSSPGLGTAACGPKGTVDGQAATPEDFDFVEGDTEPVSVPESCDGKWGRSLIRSQVVLALSDPRFLGGQFINGSLLVFTEINGRRVAAPAGTTVALLSTPPNGCTVTVSPPTVPSNVVMPTRHQVLTEGTCSGASLQFKLTFNSYEVIVPATLP